MSNDDDSGEGTSRFTRRRSLLRAFGGVGITGLAGCPGGSGDDSDPTDTSTDTPTDAATPTATRAPTETQTETETVSSGGATPTATETSTGDDAVVEPDPDAGVNVLVLSATAGFRHESIETGNRAIETLVDELADEQGFDAASVDVVDDPDGDAAAFPSTAETLAGYDAVVWNNTTGSVLDADQRAAFESYVRGGGGFVGIHAAADAHEDWDWYVDLVGTRFQSHPAIQTATVAVTDQSHPSTAHLPTVWEVEDEWYDFWTNPRGDVHVLATLDEDSYDGANMNGGRRDHPIAWCHEFDGGRSWYTGRGHIEASFGEDAFREHIGQGIAWAAGFTDGDAAGTVWDAYERTELTTDFEQPMVVEVAPDGRVFVTERSGTVSVVDEASGSKSTALELPVYHEHDEGLVGFALAPEFESTGWVYVYYSPPNEVVGADAYNQLSRFTVDGDSIDPDSEVEILRVHTQRETWGHAGGDIAFGPDGLLYLAVGDDTNPYESDGYAPLDEREGRAAYDAQRTAANTADLRGSILRIRPHEDGSYSVPDDNLFTEARDYGDEIESGLVRPEIFAMGLRNPFRVSGDRRTGRLFFADYGPDAQRWSADRGPPGIVEFTNVDEPGNFGWPYFTGPNLPYRDYDFATGESGRPFYPDAPFNDSPNNTGLTELPSVEPATMYYPEDWERFFRAPDDVDLPHDRPPHPELVGNGGPMVGSIFYAEDGFDDGALPPSFDGKHFIMEWTSGWIQYVTFDDDGTVVEIDPFLPHETFRSPMDTAVGPDGAFYLLEFGDWKGERSARLSRIEQDPA